MLDGIKVNSKGRNSVEKAGVTVLILCTLSDDGLYLRAGFSYEKFQRGIIP